MSLYRQCKISLTIFENYVFEYFYFLVSTLNRMGGVLCSVIVGERIKMRKSLAIDYWWDTISCVEVNNNVIKSINFEEFELILWFCTIFHFNTIFFNSSKIEFSKNLVGLQSLQPPPTPPPTPSFNFYGPVINFFSLNFSSTEIERGGRVSPSQTNVPLGVLENEQRRTMRERGGGAKLDNLERKHFVNVPSEII